THRHHPLITLQKQAHLRPLDLHLLVVLEILRFARRDLPGLAIPLHRDAAEVLDALRRLWKKIEMGAAEAAEMLLPLRPRQLRRDATHQEHERHSEPPPGPAAGREGTPAREWHARKIPSQFRVVKLRNR